MVFSIQTIGEVFVVIVEGMCITSHWVVLDCMDVYYVISFVMYTICMKIGYQFI